MKILLKKGGIAYDMVVIFRTLLYEALKINMDGIDPMRPWTIAYIFESLIITFLVYLNGIDNRQGITLGHHQTYNTTAQSHLKDIMVGLNRYPRSQQHAVGTQGHSTSVVKDGELFEYKGTPPDRELMDIS